MPTANPFVELYLTESIATDEFTKLFSPVLLELSETHTLFQAGNVVLSGLQGSGKTALLNLMRPEVMIAFRKQSGSLPLPEECAKFISAGINLNTSKARDFGQRRVSIEDGQPCQTAILFGDFVNYAIVYDLLVNIETIGKDRETEIGAVLGVNSDDERLDRFAARVAADDCWFGGLKDVASFRGLLDGIRARIREYRSFLNFNSNLSHSIVDSKTSAGEPIAVTAECLRECGIVPPEIPVLIRIDQFEDLMGLESHAGGEIGTEFRGVIWKMVSERDRRVSYRLGARPYSLLYPDFSTYRSRTSAEEMRDFKVVDIDALLRGKEARGGCFPKFCEDVFRKRIALFGAPGESAMKSVFGVRDLPATKAKRYAQTNRSNVVGASPPIPEPLADFLRELAQDDPLSARLGEAWLLQRTAKEKVPLSRLQTVPWNSRQWWRKERAQQALLQIAASQRQRMMWYGKEEILKLAGHNILVFLTVCQFVWAEYLRTGVAEAGKLPVSIDPAVQNIGIQEASAYWFRKIKADPNGGDDRHRFIGVVARDLRAGLRDDRRMSYPGANGFSLPDISLKEHREVGRFLDKCVAYGVLEAFRHTPKTKSRGESSKWYLFPILTPYFQLPTTHTKEPRYMRVGHLYDWFEKAQVPIGPPSNGSGGKRRERKNLQDGQGEFDFGGGVRSNDSE